MEGCDYNSALSYGICTLMKQSMYILYFNLSYFVSLDANNIETRIAAASPIKVLAKAEFCRKATLVMVVVLTLL